MLVELGNPSPIAPVHGFNRPVPSVTQIQIPDGNACAGDLTDPDAPEGEPLYGIVDGHDPAEHREHYAQLRADGVTHLPGHEALVAVTHPQVGAVATQVDDPRGPSWVRCEDNPEFGRQLAEFYGVPDEAPADLEDTHFTRFGPPGVGPLSHGPKLTTLAVGEDFQWQQMFGGISQAGTAGTATASSATTLTGTAGNGTTKYVGGWVAVASATSTTYGNILSHTDTVLTVDRWYVPATPGGTAATTPGTTDKYLILPSGPPAFFCGITTNSAAVVPASDTTLPTEITTAGGGLIRKICPVAHTLGTASGTLTPVFTVNGSDTGLPVTIAKAGIGASLLSTWSNRFHTLLGTTAVLSLIGDQLTLTDTVTMS